MFFNKSSLGNLICVVNLMFFAIILVLAGFVDLKAATPFPLDTSADHNTLEYSADSLLVKVKPKTSMAQKRYARSLVNAKKLRSYSIVKGLEHLQIGRAQGLEQAIDRLKHLPFVDYVEPDYFRYSDTSDPYYALQWGLSNTGQTIQGVTGTFDADIDAEEAWVVDSGSPSMTVAVIDTGVEYTHIDLDDNIWVNLGEIPGDNIDNDGNGYIDDVHGWDFFDNDNNPMDEEGHGTHVAGTICAEGNNSIGVSGVAWQCQIMALRFLGPNGGTTSDAIEALEYAVNLGVKVSNNSWGGGGYSQALYDAIQTAAMNGHLFIASAGNGGPDQIGDDTDVSPHYPSSYNHDNLLAVTATDNQDQLADFSNFGLNSVDLGAPGVNIASTMLSSYYWSSGTSMATPHVTGVAALLYNSHPAWTYQEVKSRILSSTRTIKALEGKTFTGGVVNALDALQESSVPPLVPSDLVAEAISHEGISLNWVDEADNEDGFIIERSMDNLDWAEIANAGKNVNAYSDRFLEAETTYFYRIKAINPAGESGYSNIASATTHSMPAWQNIFAKNEILGSGSVVGSFEDTWVDDGRIESITETSTSGRPSTRYSYLQHTWEFEVPPGNTSFHMNAWSNVSADGDSFQFSYSLDGNNYVDMFLLAAGNEASWYSYVLPPDTSGTIYVRVEDTDQTGDHRNLDTLNVDHLFLMSEQNIASPPSAPISLAAQALIAAQVDLFWTDTSSDEFGFKVERSDNGGLSWIEVATLAMDSESYVDRSVAPQTAYVYRTRAYNGSGHSSYSNEANVTTQSFQDIVLNGAGYKVKGWHYADLNWNDVSLAVDLYRDGQLIGNNINGGAYTDSSIGKGGASYTYIVCESGSASNCSNEIILNF